MKAGMPKKRARMTASDRICLLAAIYAILLVASILVNSGCVYISAPSLQAFKSVIVETTGDVTVDGKVDGATVAPSIPIHLRGTNDAVQAKD